MKSEDGQFPVLRSCCWPKGWEGHQELGKRALAVAHVTRDPYGPHPHIPTSRNGAAMAPQQNGMTNAGPCLRCADISYQTELLKRCLESLGSSMSTRLAEISRHYQYGTRCTAKCKANPKFKHAMTEWATMRRGSQGRKHSNIQQPHGFPYFVSLAISIYVLTHMTNLSSSLTS